MVAVVPSAGESVEEVPEPLNRNLIGVSEWCDYREIN